MLLIPDLIISAQDTLRTALERMTRNHKGVVFVCDAGNHLQGVLSDGDVRRTLLNNTLLMAPVSKVMNLDPVATETIEQAEALVSQRGLVAVPVIDEQTRIQAILVTTEDGVKVLRWPEKERVSVQNGYTGPVAVIPARGGSKRLPRKNLLKVGGKSLLVHAIETAQQSERVGLVLVSTDDEEIAAVAREHGAEVPWLRPADLAQDDTPTVDVVRHALSWVTSARQPAPEFALLLEPTAPLRMPEHIDQSVELLLRSKADSVVTVSALPHLFNPEELLIIEDEQLQPYLQSRTMDSRRLRGDQVPVYVQNGLVYAFRVTMMLEQGSIYGRRIVPLVTEWELFVDVDTPEDLAIAELKFQTHR